MEEVPPHQATVSSIARKAGVDPALVRYYFKNREQLLLAVIENILDNWNAAHPAPAASPAARLATQVGDMLDFSPRRTLHAAPDDRRMRRPRAPRRCGGGYATSTP